jgi:hypothetical protein
MDHSGADTPKTHPAALPQGKTSLDQKPHLSSAGQRIATQPPPGFLRALLVFARGAPVMDYDDSARQAADETHATIVPFSETPPMSPDQVQSSVVQNLFLL